MVFLRKVPPAEENVGTSMQFKIYPRGFYKTGLSFYWIIQFTLDRYVIRPRRLRQMRDSFGKYFLGYNINSYLRVALTYMGSRNSLPYISKLR
jgi:hypothetical protein